MEGPEQGSYDENRRCYDEPYSPVKCRELFADYVQRSRRKFLDEKHMYSYFLQCKTIGRLPGVQSVLEIGPGGSITASLMRDLGYDYRTLDRQEGVGADIVADIGELDATEHTGKFDLVAAFQILEHLPYSSFLSSVEKMKVMSRRWVFLSLPYHCWSFRFELRLPPAPFPNLHDLFPERIRRFLKRPRPLALGLCLPYRGAQQRRYRQQFVEEFPLAVHHWEIGRGGITPSTISGDLNSVGLEVRETFHSKAFPYHFFILCER